MRVIEIDMSFPYLIYFVAIEMTSFHEFMSICGVCLIVNNFLMIVGHMLPDNTEGQKTAKRFIIIICKLANVVLTILAFFQILISDLSFDIQEDISEFLGTDVQKGYVWKPSANSTAAN